jgi:hypothetical protein
VRSAPRAPRGAQHKGHTTTGKSRMHACRAGRRAIRGEDESTEQETAADDRGAEELGGTRTSALRHVMLLSCSFVPWSDQFQGPGTQGNRPGSRERLFKFSASKRQARRSTAEAWRVAAPAGHRGVQVQRACPARSLNARLLLQAHTSAPSRWLLSTGAKLCEFHS